MIINQNPLSLQKFFIFIFISNTTFQPFEKKHRFRGRSAVVPCSRKLMRMEMVKFSPLNGVISGNKFVATDTVRRILLRSYSNWCEVVFGLISLMIEVCPSIQEVHRRRKNGCNNSRKRQEGRTTRVLFHSRSACISRSTRKAVGSWHAQASGHR